jgi:hypothetical protein
MANNRKVYRDYWWQYAEKRPAMLKSISNLDRVLVVALVSRTAMPLTVPTGQVFSHMLGVFNSAAPSDVALLCSGIHQAWASARGSSLKGDLRYTPSDVYETMPQPKVTPEMTAAGSSLENLRRTIMLDRGLGLTKLYNLVHDAAINDADVVGLREMHQKVDQAVAEAYGWDDLDLSLEFTSSRQGTRLIMNTPTRTEILDRLLELNYILFGEISQRESEDQESTASNKPEESSEADHDTKGRLF